MELKQNGTKYTNETSNSLSGEWEKVPPVNSAKPRSLQINQRDIAERLIELQQTQKSLGVLCETVCQKSRSMQEQIDQLSDLVQTSAVIGGSRPSSQQFGITVRGPPEYTPSHPEESAVKRIQQSVNRGEQMQLESKVMELQQQVSQLSRQLQEKDLMYGQQRQRITELENKLANSHTMSSAMDWQRKIDDMSHSYKIKFQDLEAEMDKLRDENCNLQMRNNEMHRHISRGSSSGMALTSSVQPSRTSDLEDRIRLLQEQIKVCTEDFERERQDRERAHAQLQELQSENVSLQEQLEFYRERQMAEIQTRRARHNHYRPGMLEQCDAGPSDIVEDCGPQPVDGYDEVDGPRN